MATTGRGRNMSKGETPVVATPRTTTEIELGLFLEEIIRPMLGQHRYGKLLDLVDEYGKQYYGRGYVKGGNDEWCR